MKQQLVKGKRDEKAVPTQQDKPQGSALSDDLQERIAKRAYELYLERGCREGCALEDWVDAEQEILTVPTGRSECSPRREVQRRRDSDGRREKVHHR